MKQDNNSPQQVIAKTAQSLLDIHSSEQLWPLLCEAIETLTQAEFSAIYLLDTDKNQLSCPYVSGLSEEHIHFITEEFKPIQACQEDATRASLTVENLDNSTIPDAIKLIFKQEGIAALAAFSMVTADNDELGILSAYFKQPTPLSTDIIAMGEALASMGALALHKTRLLQETHLVLQREQHLNEITRTLSRAMELPTILASVVSMATELVQADAGVLGLLLDDQLITFYPYNIPPQLHLKPMPRSQSVTWEIIDSGLPLSIENYSEHPLARPKWSEVNMTSLVGVPLIANDMAVGVLMVFNLFGSEKRFTQQDVVALESVGHQAGIAIQNARMFAEAKQRADVLSVALQKQAELDNRKNKYIYSVTHELRTPLSIIHGHIDLLKDSLGDNIEPDQLQSIEIISRRAQMLSDLLEALSALLAAETQEMRREEINPIYLIYSVLTDYQIQAQEAGVQLIAEIAETLPMIKGDATHLRRVFDNLMSNAFKFTPEGGSVTLRVEQEGEDVFIAVKDTGQGIPEAQLHRIFERFYRVEGSKSRRPAGTGLGLALVKEIVEAHRGYVSVESQVDKGTTFRITLPGFMPKKP